MHLAWRALLGAATEKTVTEIATLFFDLPESDSPHSIAEAALLQYPGDVQ